MKAEDVAWPGYEVNTPEATWVCVESRSIPVPGTADGIDFLMEFAAGGPQLEGTPARRKLRLRTSSFRISEEPGFLGFLRLVVDGQLLETSPWDRFIEVYRRD